MWQFKCDITSFFSFCASFIEDFFQQTGVVLTKEDNESYERDLYMKNLPEKDVYVKHLEEAGFIDVEVCTVLVYKFLWIIAQNVLLNVDIA